MEGSASSAKHYQVCGIQPIEVMQMYLTPEEFRGYIKGNIIKYTLRFGHKDDIGKEAAKIEQYSKWLNIAISGGKVNPWE
jgi:hypothetical protein